MGTVSTGSVKLHDILRIKDEAVLVQRPLQTPHPFHFALAHGKLVVFGVVNLNPVAAFFLGHEAGRVGCAHDIRDVHVTVFHVHQADAHADIECARSPHELEIHHRLAQFVGDPQGMVARAVFQQSPELVAAKSGQRVALAQAALQDGADLAHQLVASSMAAGIVHHLELVEVQIHQRVMALQLGGTFQRQTETMLELGAIDQAGQRIMARLIGKPGRVLPLFAHVMQNHHHADEFSRAVANRRRRVHNRNFDAIVAHQQHRRRHLHRALVAQHHLDGVFRGFPRRLFNHAEYGLQR